MLPRVAVHNLPGPVVEILSNDKKFLRLLLLLRKMLVSFYSEFSPQSVENEIPLPIPNSAECLLDLPKVSFETAASGSQKPEEVFAGSQKFLR